MCTTGKKWLKVHLTTIFNCYTYHNNLIGLLLCTQNALLNKDAAIVVT